MTELNAHQRAAVTAIDRPLLVIAGAGSGKTRVITEKIAHLIRQGMPARSITAVTFTNKAAREMKSRVSRLLPEKALRGLRVSTFHALGLDIVRREHGALGLKAGISIFDEQDRIGLVRELLRQDRDGSNVEHSERCAAEVGRWKNRFVSPEQALAGTPADESEAARLYGNYARMMKSYNAVDFDDLIFLPVRLFKERPEILEAWRQRIRYLLVDEYQDTNQTQYQLIRLLTGRLGQFTVVGDDDQSIYAWRGAQPENLVQLQKDYPRLRVIKLEQNYRSSGRILRAANHLIANNPHVFEKKLWSALGDGDTIRVLRHPDEIAEARQTVADLMHHKFRHGACFADYAILYRGNYQARLLERALREFRIPYFIHGGMSFFGYAEIRDVLAYLRLLVNPDDDAAFLRIVNVPRREIGPVTLEKLGEYAGRRQVSLFDACFELGLEQVLPENAVQRLRHFAEHLRGVAERARCSDPFDCIGQLIEDIGYHAWLKESGASPKSAARKIENTQELLSWLKRLTVEDQEQPSLVEAVSKAMLLDLLDRQEEDWSGDRVNLMTLHAAKGLEFRYVYLVGMEENLLPHQTSIEEGTIEEERRLAYVGITRARQALTLGYCARRKRYGEAGACEPSRFLDELPMADLEWPDRKPVDPETKKERGQAHLAQLRSLLSS